MNINAKTRRAAWSAFFLLAFCALPLFSQFYLQEQAIEDFILGRGDQAFKNICTEKLSVNMEPPFLLQEYFHRERLIEKFSAVFSLYKTQKIEWISLQVEDNFAIQSLNVILEDGKSARKIFYKFIFFLTKDKEWKLYNLRGLRI